MVAALLFALPALIAFAGIYRVADRPRRLTLRYAGIAALWTTFIALIISRS